MCAIEVIERRFENGMDKRWDSSTLHKLIEKANNKYKKVLFEILFRQLNYTPFAVSDLIFCFSSGAADTNYDF